MSDVVLQQSEMLLTMLDLQHNRKEMSRAMKFLSDEVQKTQDKTNALKVGGYGGATAAGFMVAASLAGGPVSLITAAGQLSAISGSYLAGANLYEWFSTSGNLKVWDDLYANDARLVNQLASYSGLNRGDFAYSFTQIAVGAGLNVPKGVELFGHNVQASAGIVSALSLPKNVVSFWTSLSELLSREKTGLAKLMKDSSDALEELVNKMDIVIQRLSGAQQVQPR